MRACVRVCVCVCAYVCVCECGSVYVSATMCVRARESLYAGDGVGRGELRSGAPVLKMRLEWAAGVTPSCY